MYGFGVGGGAAVLSQQSPPPKGLPGLVTKVIALHLVEFATPSSMARGSMIGPQVCPTHSKEFSQGSPVSTARYPGP
jgi:hypothetical protein